ncbi:hypothetical protein ABZ379_46970, partial [Streptomyces canus]|uniref:hypothetical protein n=1 Tax=Streptomyces canus TaxID=58343 RepID=UPI0033FF8BA4
MADDHAGDADEGQKVFGLALVAFIAALSGSTVFFLAASSPSAVHRSGSYGGVVQCSTASLARASRVA